MSTITATGTTAPAEAPAAKTPALVYLARMQSKESRRTLLGSLQLLASKLSGGKADALSFPWHRLGYAETQAARAWLMSKYAGATTNKHLAALRGVLKECWRLRLMSEEQYRRAADVEVVKIERPPAGRMLARDEVTALFAAAAAWPSPRRERDGALLAISVCLGVRRFELAGLQFGDVDLSAGRVVLKGKGGKMRELFLPPRALGLVVDWVNVRGTWSGALLAPFDKHGNVATRELSCAGVDFVLAELGRAAKVRDFGPHDLRRTFISELLDRGVDMMTVSKMAGHARPETTGRYDRRGSERKKQAAALIDVPIGSA
jgi:integrase